MILFVQKRQNGYICFVCTVTLLLIFVAKSGCSKDVSFLKSSICDVDERISNGCSTRRENLGRGMISCSVKCARDEDCIGASLDEKGDCFTHIECPHVSGGCNVKATDHHYVTRRRCGNGGVWDPATSTCQCVGTWLGPYCEDYPTSCIDLLKAGFTKMTVRMKLDINGDGSCLFPVTMKLHTNWCHVFLFVNAGQRDFNRTWTEYREGFYIDDSHFWIGLDHMYALSQAIQDIRLTTKVNFKNGSSKSKSISRNKDVNISELRHGYALRYSSAMMDLANANGFSLGDCWSGLQNKSFSTWDRDEDEDLVENCASNAGSGWWYAGCDSPCNMLGWSLKHKGSKPPSSIMRLTGIDLEMEKDTFAYIESQFDYKS